MNIDGVNPVGGIDRTDQQVDAEQQRIREEAPDTQQTEDRVEVSSGNEVSRYSEELDSIPEVREERVEALQQAIEKGNYNVPAEDIASAIINELA